MQNPFRRISDWLKYGRLGYYPALKGFERDAALRRLKAYEREERAACQPGLRTAEILTVAAERASHAPHFLAGLTLQGGRLEFDDDEHQRSHHD